MDPAMRSPSEAVVRMALLDDSHGHGGGPGAGGEEALPGSIAAIIQQGSDGAARAYRRQSEESNRSKVAWAPRQSVDMFGPLANGPGTNFPPASALKGVSEASEGAIPFKAPSTFRQKRFGGSTKRLHRAGSENFAHLISTMTAETGFFLKKGRYLLNPASKFCIWWWRLTVLLTYFNLFQVPFTTGFPETKTPVVEAIIWVIDMVFFLDIAMTLNTPATHKGEHFILRWQIAKHQMTLPRFWIDVIAALPFDRIFARLFPANGWIPLLAFTRVLRSRRLALLLSMMEKSVDINYESVVLLKLFTLITALCHMEACLFWFIGSLRNTGWMHVADIIEDLDDTWGNYLVSLYWAVTTYSTVGYGDIAPENVAERTFAIFVMIINMALTAYVLGNITMLTTKVDQAILEYRGMVAEVKNYLVRQNMDPALHVAAIQHLSTKQEMADETDQALQHCAPHIRNQILSALYRDKLQACKILQGTSTEIVESLAQAGSAEFFQQDTAILSSRERAVNLYYVLSGALECFDAAGTLLRMMGPGHLFG